MLSDTACEICGTHDWHVLGERRYRKAEAASLSAYQQKRFRVLFEQWFPDLDEVTLTSVCCDACGFIIYLPRPQAADVDAKYRYIALLGQDYGRSPAGSALESKRSADVYRHIGAHIDLAAVARVLDYGGGDGRLMQAFRDAGKACFLIDYNANCVAGVNRLGDTLDVLPATQGFDLIVCSHVIEHVAQPLQVIARLARHLEADGHLFVEVPMEVWRRVPLHDEPVTHINFFTPNSLYNLLAGSGLQVVAWEMGAFPHASGARRSALRSLARRLPRTERPSLPRLRYPDAVQMVEVNRLRAFAYYARRPRALYGLLRAKLAGRS